MKKNSPVPEKQKKKRIRIHETTAENDIRYRGPLSYQHFQILGWLCIVAAQATLLLKLGSKMDARVAELAGNYMGLLSVISAFSLPFLLIANFARILNGNEAYRSQLLRNTAASAAIAGLFYVFFYRYLAGAADALLTDSAETTLQAVQSVLTQTVKDGFLAFNIFIDLLLCTLVMFFLDYRPRRVFTGKALHLFRLFAVFPIGYEVFCMILRIRAARGISPIPVWAWPLLPVKPFMTFVLFIVLAVFVKTRELRFRRHGKSHAEYQAFLKTNRNSRNFSIFLAVMLIVVSIVDFGVALGFSLNESLPSIMADMEKTEQAAEGTAEESGTAAPDVITLQTPDGPVEIKDNGFSEETNAAILRGAAIADAVGFGNSVSLFLLSPFVLLFSYTRIPRNKKAGMLIPVTGVALILVLYLESFHFALYNLPIPKISLEELREYLGMFSSLLQ